MKKASILIAIFLIYSFSFAITKKTFAAGAPRPITPTQVPVLPNNCGVVARVYGTNRLSCFINGTPDASASFCTPNPKEGDTCCKDSDMCFTVPQHVEEATSYKVCDQIPDNVLTADGQSAKNACYECIGGDPNNPGSEGIWTAVGCIKSDPTKLIQALIRLGLGVAGGVALLSLLAGGFMFSVSEGDPKRVGQAKELIVASLSGLLFIIFSVTLLQFVGWSILKIPGFGG